MNKTVFLNIILHLHICLQWMVITFRLHLDCIVMYLDYIVMYID